MAKRKNKLLLSDLFPELAAEREVAEEEEREREEEEPVRKKSKMGRPLNEEKWNARLEVCKEWKRTKGRFPKANRKDKEEMSLYKWLNECKPGGKSWTQARWEKLNEAFGVGWEKECFPVPDRYIPLVHSSVTTNAVRGTLGRALLAPKPAAVLQVLLMV